MARWGGWGALWQVFDEDKQEWTTERDQLKELLSDAEYKTARLTTINAHFTDPALVGPIWRAVERLGLSSGRVLEPGCGAGTFIGMAPPGVILTGVEFDPLTAAVAAGLYPSADIRAESFAATRFPTGYFDGAVGNAPFGDVVLHDPRYNQARLSLHNYFVVKSLELVRPGGVVAFLTSRYTMDAVNPAARRAMIAKADLIAAVRLPTGAHRRAAGTDAVTDLLILRRREPGERPRDAGWETTSPRTLPDEHGPETVKLNDYWEEHPDHVMARMELAIGMHGAPAWKSPSTIWRSLGHTWMTSCSGSPVRPSTAVSVCRHRLLNLAPQRPFRLLPRTVSWTGRSSTNAARSPSWRRARGCPCPCQKASGSS